MSPEEMARKSVVYLESTIPSFLTSKISPQIVTAAKQLTTREWWEQSRHRYHLVVSQFVWDEIAVGDSEASHRRCEVIQGLDELEINEEVVELYKKLLDSGLFPKKSQVDAAHVAVCSVYGVDILLTWNCTHLANADVLPGLRSRLAGWGYQMPLICTPFEINGEESP
jgi:hypothetical protein